MKEVSIPLKYAKNIYKVLSNHESLGYAIMSIDIKKIVSDEAYKKLMGYYEKYHNANCGPFNRTLLNIIKEAEKQPKKEG